MQFDAHMLITGKFVVPIPVFGHLPHEARIPQTCVFRLCYDRDELTTLKTRLENRTMNTYTIGDATVTVEHDGRDWSPEDSNYRQRYSYVIATPDW